MLSNFQIDNAAPFQSFLVGQPQFRRMIASPIWSSCASASSRLIIWGRCRASNAANI